MPLCLRSRSAVPSSAFACSALYALPRQDLGSSTPSTARPSNAELALGSAALSLQALLSGQARPGCCVPPETKVGRHLWTLLSCAPHLLPSRMQPACILPLTGPSFATPSSQAASLSAGGFEVVFVRRPCLSVTLGCRRCTSCSLSPTSPTLLTARVSFSLEFVYCWGGGVARSPAPQGPRP